MSSALSIAAGGIQVAARSFELAARNVVTAGAATTAQVAAGSQNVQAVPGSSGAPVSTPHFELPDLTSSLIDLKLAEISYKAQIQIFKAADRIQDQALDLIS